MTIVCTNQAAAKSIASIPEYNAGQPLYRLSKRSDMTTSNLELFKTPKFRDLIAQRLSSLVQIPTVTYDEMGLVGEDSRWEVFEELPKYFEKTFPRM